MKISELGKYALSMQNIMQYKKIGDKYRIYCTYCQKYELVDKQKFKEIRASKICPMCWNEFKNTSVRTIKNHIWVKKEDNEAGLLQFVKEFGKKQKNYYIKTCEWNQQGKCRTRLMSALFYSISYSPYRKKWSKWKKPSNYTYYFININNSKKFKERTKKQYLEDMVVSGFNLKNIQKKSNQLKIIKEHILNNRQIAALIAFDLKSIDEIHKYNKYIRKCEYRWGVDSRIDINKKLNIYYLDYLSRNNIDINEFYDYMFLCAKLNRKLDKPKEFQHRHNELSLIYEAIEDNLIKEENSKGVKQRYKELKKHAQNGSNWSISPFKTADEVADAAHKLHNCMASNYLIDYANGTTDLYHLDIDGNLVVAIEIYKGELEQAYQDHNKECTDVQNRIIKKWCARQNFVC